MSNNTPKGRDAEITSRMMSKVRNKDTEPELTVRRMLHAQGYRFRVHYGNLCGKPDIVFVRQRLAIFVDGDFWHGNAWRIRGLSSMEAQFPNRTDWWVAKLKRTMRRDTQVTTRLQAEGWGVLRFWESAIQADPDTVVDTIVAEVKSRS
jgi:DNA mismatch endonuclease (patch repair protein)